MTHLRALENIYSARNSLVRLLSCLEFAGWCYSVRYSAGWLSVGVIALRRKTLHDSKPRRYGSFLRLKRHVRVRSTTMLVAVVELDVLCFLWQWLHRRVPCVWIWHRGQAMIRFAVVWMNLWMTTESFSYQITHRPKLPSVTSFCWNLCLILDIASIYRGNFP